MRLPPLVWMYLPIFGIRSTCDSTWRPNSRSTFSRSSRIGSKICVSAGGEGFTAVQVGTLSRAEEGMKVRGRSLRRLLDRDAMHLRQRGNDSGDMRRLVPLAAMRHRRQKRAVGLAQETIERYGPDRLPQGLGFRKRHDARERDVEA